MQALFGILVAIHGLITAAVGAGSISNPRGVTAPATDWFPSALGASWALQGDAARVGGGLWVIAGVGLLATAAAVLGIGVPTSAWPTLALGSTVIGLAALALFFHPYYAIAVIVDIALIAAATIFRSTAKSVLGV